MAGLLVPLATAEVWLGFADEIAVGQPSPITVRLPSPSSSELFEKPGRILIARGQVPTDDQVSAYRRLFVEARADAGKAALGLFVSFALVGILLFAHLRTTQRGR